MVPAAGDPPVPAPDALPPAQDPASDLGKIIHLTAEGQAAPGGPWAARGGRAASYWSIGHRNVLGLAFAPDGRLWASEMGPQGGDELVRRFLALADHPHPDPIPKEDS